MRKSDLMARCFRILAATLGGLAILVLCFGIFIRQPNVGRYPFPPGPRAEPARLQAHVEHLCIQATPRSPTTPAGLDLAAQYIKDVLSTTGATVTEQRYTALRQPFVNISALFGPDTGRRVVVGAHYDVSGELPGADDNASGVAGLLELARLLSSRALPSQVELVAFSTEEPPYFGGAEMGSAFHARALAGGRVRVEAMIGLEMIGYFSAVQPYSTWPLYVTYPRTGDFIVIVGRWEDRTLAREVKKSFRGATPVRALSYTGPRGVGADLSDHRNYWALGPAVMVTDTAYMRNPNYHRASDVPATLDYDRMAGVVDGVLSSTVRLASAAGR